ncbi:MAG: peptidoglycan-binding protein [Acetobacteraceae bacterium]|nr:peptidoglycan-binding protein [Acetobacteraceae bacterium]
MATVQPRRSRGGFEPWPGYVDALSTLLMVIIFVLLVFVLAQAFLSAALSGRDQALARLNRQIAELSDMLALERGTSEELRASVARLSADLRAASAARDTLARRLEAALAERDRAGSERDALARERDRLAGLLADAQGRAEVALNRLARLEAQLAEALTRADQARIEADARARAEAETARALAEARRALGGGAGGTRTIARGGGAARSRGAGRAGDDRRAAVRTRAPQRRSPGACRPARSAGGGSRPRRRACGERGGEPAAPSRRCLPRNDAWARPRAPRSLCSTARSPNSAPRSPASPPPSTPRSDPGRDKDAQIANLSQRLNLALAARVEELQRYRSEFYGRMREVLGNRADIQVVGDRFVLPSEILFPPGSAELNTEGAEQIRRIAGVIRELARDIPPDIPWILRVDGHADRTPIAPGGRFASNWELSAARAITVVRLLALLGVPENRLAATGFGEFQPIDPRDTPEALARNRRIEFRLTDR